MPSKKKSKDKRTRSTIANAKKSTTKRAAKQAVKTIRSKQIAKKKQPKKKNARARRRRKQQAPVGRRQQLQGRPGIISGRQSGDLDGLSRAAAADSESVDELVEEGNLFEAGAVAGVEEADAADEKEVRTREVPEDDVPQEYLDEE
jgi:hypothetical protein